MYLKKLELNGFKSFAQKTELDFKSKISSIVGPNGSGKSNVAESFRFVLGEQSMKNMRGKKGEDLIFSGKNGRSNRGSVKVVFDNRDRTLNIDYDEVVIERIVYRDGNNEYLINGTRVRAKDVLELLTSANIGASGHHIISQGEADKILSISPKERKGVIEEALGLKAFVIKKNESERKLERTDENLKEVRTRERVNAPRIRFLKKEVEKIQRAEELRRELEGLYANFLPGKKEVEERLQRTNLEIEERERARKVLEEKISQKRKDLYESKNSLNSDEQKRAEIEKINGERRRMEEEKNALQKELARNELLMEEERAREQAFLAQKEKVEENLKIYREKRERIKSLIFNKIREYFRGEENLLEELAGEILNFFGIRESGIEKENFDPELIKRKEEENKVLEEKIKNADEILESLSKKIRILNSDSEDAGEVMSREIEIEILKLEKSLGLLNSEISQLNNLKFKLERELENYKREEN